MNPTQLKSSLDAKQDAIIEEFSQLGDDWTEKYQYLIRQGQELPELDSRYVNDETRLKGCQAQVWLHSYMSDGNLHFEAKVDAHIVRGIAALLIRVLSDNPPETIHDADLYFIDKIGLEKHLSPVRSNGLNAMVEEIRRRARDKSS
ncbi:MAG: Cysteine desulfuration protein SufE [Candidatus Marinimicrobia bacterium]|nr:Cysteine desulfuration protein SufE [Candidatus Neomarinimicrobiota bacterium]